MIRELDCVELTADLPEFGLHRGDLGAVVLVHETGDAIEVEFVSEAGETLALLTLKTDQLRRIDVAGAPAERKSPRVPTGR